MAFINFLALVLIFCSLNIFTVHTDKNKHDVLDTLLDDIIKEIPRKHTSRFFSNMLNNEYKKKTIKKSKKKHLQVSPSKEELPTKKSTEAFPEADYNPAISVALTKPSVYLVSLGSKTGVFNTESQEYNAEKRYNIPQSAPTLKYDSILRSNPTTAPVDRKETVIEDDTKRPDYRTKRQEESVLNERLPMLASISNNDIKSVPVQTLNTIIPAQAYIGEAGVGGDISGINSNKVLAVVPVKVETPITGALPSSVAMVPRTAQETQPATLGTTRSVLPETTLIQTSPDLSTKASSILHSPNTENLLVGLGEQQNRLTISEPQDSGLTPENKNEVIKIAQVPLRLFSEKTPNSNDSPNENANGEITGIKLDHLSTKPSTSKNEDDKTNFEAKKEKSKEEINKETLRVLQSRLTNIISKLEQKVNAKEGRLKQKEKQESLNEISLKKPSEKSLKFLKQRLSRVMKKFNSKPGARQPFTIGKEWANVMNGTGARNRSKTNDVVALKKPQNATENEGNWPSIASQLLKKLNRALIKLQERRVARSLGKDAVMHFSFDKPKSTVDNKNLVQDKSGHFNDASVSEKVHSSARTYGSCGNALILNSGNLRFIDKYFKRKPTKAITLAMWVRTNVTGYVKWFARDSGPLREFNTHTKYPLVHKNVWTHLCGTFNSSTGITRIYVDGKLKAEKVNRKQETIPADFTPAGIGPEFGDENLIAVDEVYMFARALDPSEVITLYDDCEFNRMVLHYGFQKINRSAGLVFDQSGLHHDGHLQEDARILDNGCEKCGSCLVMNVGDSPQLTVQATHFQHKPTKAISIGAWFNLNSTTGKHPLFSVTESVLQLPLLELLMTDGKIQWKGYDKDNNEIFNTATARAVVPEGVWVHILATFDSLHGLAKIFIDGHQKAAAKTATRVPINEDWSEIKIGGQDSQFQASGGYMDELVLYNWELDPSEISYIMKYCPDHPKLVSFTVHVPLD